MGRSRPPNFMPSFSVACSQLLGFISRRGNGGALSRVISWGEGWQYVPDIDKLHSLSKVLIVTIAAWLGTTYLMRWSLETVYRCLDCSTYSNIWEMGCLHQGWHLYLFPLISTSERQAPSAHRWFILSFLTLFIVHLYVCLAAQADQDFTMDSWIMLEQDFRTCVHCAVLPVRIWACATGKTFAALCQLGDVAHSRLLFQLFFTGKNSITYA